MPISSTIYLSAPKCVIHSMRLFSLFKVGQFNRSSRGKEVIPRTCHICASFRLAVPDSPPFRSSLCHLDPLVESSLPLLLCRCSALSVLGSLARRRVLPN